MQARGRNGSWRVSPTQNGEDTVNHPQLLATALLTTGELLQHNITAIINSYSHSLVLPSPLAAAKELYCTTEHRNHAAKCHSNNISTRHDQSTKHQHKHVFFAQKNMLML